MWRSKKFIIAAVLAAVILVGTIGGVVLAQTSDSDDNQPGAGHEATLDRVCEIYQDNTGDSIDPEALEAAFAQARDEMRAEAQQNRLQKMVEQGRITQEQADELQDWWGARPDVPFEFGFRAQGAFPGKGGMRGFGGPCAPAE